MTSVRCWIAVMGLSAYAGCFAGMESHLKPGMPFTQARQILLAKRWHPIRMHSHIAKEGEDGFPVLAEERELIRRGMIELGSCSLGESFCNFYYRRRGDCLLLETKGEDLRSMQLVVWKIIDCPNPENRPRGPLPVPAGCRP